MTAALAAAVIGALWAALAAIAAARDGPRDRGFPETRRRRRK
jgi:hypothetical protein